MKTIKYYIFLIIIFLGASQAKAQFKSAELSVSGLTCSMCSFATEKALRTLDFIEDVKPDLNTNVFALTFKSGSKVSIDQIQAKVKGAGFSVFKLVTVFNFDNVNVKNGYDFSYNGESYHFMNVPDKTLKGDVRITFLDKGFVADTDYQKMLKEAQYKGLANIKAGNQRVYHVTI